MPPTFHPESTHPPQHEPLPASVVAAALPESEHEFYARDVYRQGASPRAVVRPRSRDELRTLVVDAARAGLALIIRGGGASYTDAHLPATTASILIDTAALNRVLSIDEQDMTVQVEPGVTWAALDAALAARGLKVPFVGTFSGLAATVGGTLSQNANGHGSNAAGISADSVIAVEVLTPRGELLHTATAGSSAAPGLFRNHGPDLTGLFLGDAGALGIKTRIVLKLLRRKPVFEAASFAFADFRSLHGCMSRLAAERLDDKSFGLDQALQQGQIARQDAGTIWSIARSIWSSSPNATTAATSLLRMAVAGTRGLAKAPYAAHYIVDGHQRLEARSKIATLRRIATGFGREIANSVPTVVRANPFQPLHNMLGPAGERWVPLHGLLPHSRVPAFHEELTSFVASHRTAMTRHHVHVGAMFSCIGASTFLYEPALYWQDQRTVFHERMMDPDYLARLPTYAANPAGAELVETLRTGLIRLMHTHGAAHFQIGKLYPYLDGRDTATLHLLRAIKQELDPDGRLNPGALGL
ncbi:MAG: FAD-binding oxidoreductase [Sinobacteraceae bacterium]|nr:FAD-binding oxidoreductase [Nevskiaceae bacterium]MCP5338590.1 FAD-binding oxidoreductase [Nevskiaceae bacterium]MCP5466731.1 FAD-binding oxidoreductase [Nevskiaceae bacterium]MCP5470532.1 FAD-binding oxidoreductase [Nevskiaceae bacterium]